MHASNIAQIFFHVPLEDGDHRRDTKGETGDKNKVWCMLTVRRSAVPVSTESCGEAWPKSKPEKTVHRLGQQKDVPS